MAALTERRSILAGLGALAAAPAMAQPAAMNPDAALLVMVAEIEAIDLIADPLWEEWGELTSREPRYHEVQSLLKEPRARRVALVNAVELLPARTLAGIQAKARIAKRDCFILNRDDKPDEEDVMVYGLLRDLLALSA